MASIRDSTEAAIETADVLTQLATHATHVAATIDSLPRTLHEHRALLAQMQSLHHPVPAAEHALQTTLEAMQGERARLARCILTGTRLKPAGYATRDEERAAPSDADDRRPDLASGREDTLLPTASSLARSAARLLHGLAEAELRPKTLLLQAEVAKQRDAWNKAAEDVAARLKAASEMILGGRVQELG